ncbi:MAG: NADP-dependent oxidoreductase [Bacteroidales bacterium]|nr:NADP-dependent oxidoreductase [Bacteroidales bacterium]
MSKVFILKSRPDGFASESNFDLIETPVGEMEDGQVLVRGKFYSVDPYMRGRMSDAKSYIAPFELNAPITGGVVAVVVDSKSPDFVKGDYVVGMMKWQDIQIVWAKDIQKIDVQIAPPSYYLGLFGLTGLTAYLGLNKIGKPKAAETVVVSGAGGAVGMVVGQIAKIKGCNVIGIAGHKDKINYLKNQLDFDNVIDYHDLDKLDNELMKSAPLGVDIYFDNVGGAVSDHVMKYINHNARIIICGQIALYNDPAKAYGPYPQIALLKNSALMKGFIVGDYQDSFHDAQIQLIQWYKEGALKGHETIIIGFDKLPKTFISLFQGDNIGKLIVEAP